MSGIETITSGRREAVASDFMDLADAFGVGVIAEGMENTDQIVCLEKMGCKIGQGYHFYPPVPGSEALWVLTDGEL